MAAGGYQSSPRLGQSGPLTGLQLFIRVKCKLGLLGQEQVVEPLMLVGKDRTREQRAGVGFSFTGVSHRARLCSLAVIVTNRNCSIPEPH